MSIEKEIKKQEEIAMVDKVNAEYAAEVTAEQDIRDAFNAEDEEKRYKNFWNKMTDLDEAYKKVYSEGIEDGNYLLSLVSIRLSKTRKGEEQIVCKWQLEEPYVVDDIELRKLKFTTFSYNQFNNGLGTNPALRLLKGIYRAYQLPEPKVFTLNDLIKNVEDQVLKQEKVKVIKGRVTSQHSGGAVFNQVAL